MRPAGAKTKPADFERFAGVSGIVAGVVGLLYSFAFIVLLVAGVAPGAGAFLSSLFLAVSGLLTTGKLSLVDEIVSPEFVNHSAMPGMATRGPEAVKQLATAILTAFPDLQYALEAEIAEGDKVVHRATARGTNTGSFMGIPPTGKQATWTESHIVRFAGTKCVEHWGEVDLLGIMQQLGLAPAPGQ